MTFDRTLTSRHSAKPSDTAATALSAENVSKTFILHTQGGASLRVIENLSLTALPGEVVVLGGPSGVGKSTVLRMLYGNYRPTGGRIMIRHDGDLVDIVAAPPRTLIQIRRRSLGWVSQFLRVIPRVPTLDIVMEPLLVRGVGLDEAQRRAGEMLERLNLPSRLWTLAPATFSGGEQQRVNIARAFVAPTPILLIDEPTASLDAVNRQAVAEIICDARDSGTAIVAIFHDEEVRNRAGTRVVDLSRFRIEPAKADA